jgi:hypothetical protein
MVLYPTADDLHAHCAEFSWATPLFHRSFVDISM